MGRNCPIVHDIREKEEGIFGLVYFTDFSPNHRRPFIEDLLEIVGCDLSANDIALLDGVVYSLYKLLFMSLDTK